MAYTSEAIAPSGSDIVQQLPSVMREERVITPYTGSPDRAAILSRRIAESTSNPSAIGQRDLSEGNRAVELPKTEETVTLSPQAAALARKEQKFRQQQQELAEKTKALESERAEIAQLKAIKSKLAQKDYSDLESLVNYDEYTDYLLKKQAGSTPEQQALKKLELEVEGVKKAHQESISKQFDAAVNERRKAVVALVNSDESYSSIKGLKAQEAVVQHILDTWEQDSEELSVEQAAKEVEEELYARAQKWASLPKLKSVSPTGDEKKQLPPLKSGLKTITNQVTTGEIKKPVKSFQGMSDSERWAEARRRAEEKLKLRQG